jgi:hypothetical protein
MGSNKHIKAMVVLLFFTVSPSSSIQNEHNRDSSIFNQRDNGHLIYILEYVDDIIITGTNSQYAFSLISTLG